MLDQFHRVTVVVRLWFLHPVTVRATAMVPDEAPEEAPEEAPGEAQAMDPDILPLTLAPYQAILRQQLKPSHAAPCMGAVKPL